MKKQKHLWKDIQLVPFLYSLYKEEEERKKPNPPSSKEAKKILITVSPSNKKGPQQIEINLRQALRGQKAKVSPRQYQSCSAPD